MPRHGAIDPNLLRSFLQVAETGSFTHAAEIAGRTQSTVSTQIRRLETMLGQTLFARSKGTDVRLTEAGTRLLPRATELLSLHDSIWDDFHARPGGTPPPMPLSGPSDYTVPHQAQREAFTGQVMLTLLTNDKFTEAYAAAMQSVEAKRPIDPTNLSAREDSLFMALLSMLEYIAINFISNTIDREMVLRQRRSGLLRVYQSLEHYIKYKREAWDRPNAYRSFEMLVKNYILADLPAPTER